LFISHRAGIEGTEICKGDSFKKIELNVKGYWSPQEQAGYIIKPNVGTGRT